MKFIIGIFFYYIVSNKLSNQINDIFVGNAVSSVHTLSAFILSALWLENKNEYIMNLMFLNTCGYYLYDGTNLIYKLKNKCDIANSLYLYHHIISIFIINYHPMDINWMEIFFWSEFANLQTNYVYYLLKREKLENKKYYITNIAKCIQLILYVYVRIYKLSLLTYIELNTTEYLMPIQLSLPLLPIGYLWTYFIYKSIHFNKLCNCIKYKS